MHGLTAWINQSHVDDTTHWHPSRWDTKQNQHLHASTLEILSFSTVSEKRKVYRFRQDCEHSATFALCRQMFILCWTDPVYNTEIVSHSHYVCDILNGILRECFFWHMNHNTNATTPQMLLSILQGALKKKCHTSLGKCNFPGVVCSIVSIIYWEADGGHLNCDAAHAFVSANCWLPGHVLPQLQVQRFASAVPGGGCLWPSE